MLIDRYILVIRTIIYPKISMTINKKVIYLYKSYRVITKYITNNFFRNVESYVLPLLITYMK